MRNVRKIKVRVPQNKVAEFCRRNRIRRLSFFGSVLTKTFRRTSDIDVLVEFEEGHTPGLAFFSLQDELSKILKRKVDLNTPAFLSKHFRDEVIEQAQVQYQKD